MIYLQQYRPQVTLEASYQKIKPYTRERLENFKKMIEERGKRSEIRGA